MIRRILFWVGLALVLVTVNGQIAAKQAILSGGTAMLAPLRPVDPRSLMQGDYMALAYADPFPQGSEPPERGIMVVRLEDGVIRFLRLDDGSPLAAGEHRLAYRTQHGQVWFAAESFLFQEGLGDLYSRARFAMLRVSAGGTALLAGLADEERREIKP